MTKEALLEINQARNDICQRAWRENEKSQLYFDLTKLYVDIIYEVSKTDRKETPKIHHYAGLLEQELQLYSPVDAYKIGANAKGQSKRMAYWDYRCAVTNTTVKRKLDFQIQECFNELAELVGNHTLIEEFTAVYRAVHGPLRHNIFSFIELGQALEAE